MNFKKFPFGYENTLKPNKPVGAISAICHMMGLLFYEQRLATFPVRVK